MNKTEQLIDAIDHPENYSDEELHALLADPEVKEAYNTMCSMRAALAPKPEADVNEEWHIFRDRNLPAIPSRKSFGLKLRYTKKLLKNSAAVVAVCVLSAAAIATVIETKLYERQNPDRAASDAIKLSQVKPATSEEDTSTVENMEAVKYEPVLFENRPLEEILNTIKDRYEVEVMFKSQEAKKLRLYFNWNPELPISDIVDLLNNFRQFSIRLSGNTLIVE